jgi:hypothetical protein
MQADRQHFSERSIMHLFSGYIDPGTPSTVSLIKVPALYTGIKIVIIVVIRVKFFAKENIIFELKY